MMPNFIIGGEEKCGTNALMFYLVQHPEVSMKIGEIHFFSKRYHKGLKYYKNLFNELTGSTIGEKSASYLSDPRSAFRIYKANTEMKLIFMLRNPVDRAYSQYWMDRTAGRAFRSFENIIKDKDCEYLERGKYYKHLNHYFKYFNKNSIQILISEDFKKNKKDYLKRICHFLGINDNINTITDIKNKHVGKMPRNRFLSLLMLYIKPLYFINKDLYFKIRDMNKIDKNYSPMKKTTRYELEDFFAPSIKLLQDVVNDVDLKKHWYDFEKYINFS